MRNALLALVAISGFVALKPPVADGAAVLWSNADWIAPALQHVEAGVDGGDVTWTFGGDTGSVSSIDNNNRLTGGSGVTEALGVGWNPNTVGEQLTLDITFTHTYGVTGATMSFFDIDRDNKKAENAKGGDQITITATTTTGAIIYPTFTGLGSGVQVLAPGTLIGIDKVNINSGDGNATITFAGDIASIHIVYSDQGAAKFEAGGLHEFGIDGVTFVPGLAPIPEPDPRCLLVISPVVFLLVRRRHAASRRR
jgi:hypothetical protein